MDEVDRGRARLFIVEDDDRTRDELARILSPGTGV